ncbi:hypothetical protein [Halostella litorea]|uniref:hypothetical protein n=1 Tax=Halostella litorea TaxID=2528831 RepID=UPI0010928FB3|nr:hypothetical protein [Halostella litorea]
MADDREHHGQDAASASFQAILKVFDYADDAELTAQDVADGLQQFGINQTVETTTRLLDRMEAEQLVARRDSQGAPAVWSARVAPEPSDETAAKINERARDSVWVRS